MIGFLRGVVASAGESGIVLDVNGVGYRVNTPTSVLAAVNPGDADVTVHTSLVVKDDAMDLYGFMTVQERDIFETLTTVSGIGPKVAVKLLSIPRETLVEAIQAGDVAVLTTVPGVGKKIAQRVCLELRDKLSPGFKAGAPSMPAGIAADGEVGAAMLGLQALGFTGSEVRAFIKSVPESELKECSAQEIITMCLKKRK